jgi:hypothetical protein
MKKAAIAMVALVAAAVFVGAAVAGVVTVAPDDPSWAPNATTGLGTVTFTSAYGAPAGLGTTSLELTTSASTADKADYWTNAVAGTPLGDVSTLAYWTYQQSASFSGGAVSLQLALDLNGGTLADGGFTTLVYEPYLNGDVTPGVWQSWNASAGRWWSTRTGGGLVAGGGGCPCYTKADVWARDPDAVVLGIGVNIGSNNPSYVVATDGVQFNDTTWDFEAPPSAPQTKDDCKHGGWEAFGFKNQGACVSFVATGGKHA